MPDVHIHWAGELNLLFIIYLFTYCILLVLNCLQSICLVSIHWDEKLPLPFIIYLPSAFC
jgi:hypothetical protein